MNGVEGIGRERPTVVRRPAARPRRALPPEPLILAIAVAATLLGAVTHPLLSSGVGIALSMLVMLHHMATDVHALRAWAEELRTEPVGTP